MISNRRLPPRPAALPRARSEAAGFSLVELMISTVIFAIVTAGSLGMFTISTRQANLTRQLQEEEFAIRLDLATIQTLNDRFTCASGSCQIDTDGAPPGQGEYYPSTTDAQTNFATLCSVGGFTVLPTTSGVNYGTGLLSLISSNAIAATASMKRLGISRTVSADTTSPTAHRYTVTWTGADSTVLRQISLVPTTAAWCP